MTIWCAMPLFVILRFVWKDPLARYSRDTMKREKSFHLREQMCVFLSLSFPALVFPPYPSAKSGKKKFEMGNSHGVNSGRDTARKTFFCCVFCIPLPTKKKKKKKKTRSGEAPA